MYRHTQTGSFFQIAATTRAATVFQTASVNHPRCSAYTDAVPPNSRRFTIRCTRQYGKPSKNLSRQIDKTTRHSIWIECLRSAGKFPDLIPPASTTRRVGKECRYRG